LKKKISALVDEVIFDCQVFIDHTKDNDKKEKAFEIVEKAIELHNQLIDRVNYPGSKDNPKLVKQHYASICKDLKEGVHKLFGQISALVK
jgi:precorrin-2 methylase